MKTASALFRGLALAACLPLAALAQITIATPAVDGWAAVYTAPSTWQTWGQTFVAPDAKHTQLDRFDLRVASSGYYSPAEFTTYVAQWNPTSRQVVGAPLWTSSLQSSAGLATYIVGGETLSFTTGGINLTAGQAYMLLVVPSSSAAGDPTKETDLGITSSSYAAGNLVEFYSPSRAQSYATLSTTSVYDYTSYDFAFGATFSEPGSTAVPEPAAPAAILALGLVAGLVALRRRQQRAATGCAAPADCASAPSCRS